MNNTTSINHLQYASYAYHRDNGISASTMSTLSPWSHGARLFERRYINERRPSGIFVTVIKEKKYPPKHGAIEA